MALTKLTPSNFVPNKRNQYMPVYAQVFNQLIEELEAGSFDLAEASITGDATVGGDLDVIGNVVLNSANVTQATSITTGVTVNGNAGIITTVSATTAGAASSTFTVTNSKATTTCKILVSVNDYAGTFTTNGIPLVSVNNKTAGTFDITISNAHASNALNGVLKIAFLIVE